MKKTILAVVLPSLMFAGTVSAATVYKSEDGSADFYGQLRTELKKKPNKEMTLGAGSSRAGVKAEYQLVEDIKVFGKVEFGLQGSGDYVMKNRLHYAGVSGDFGKVTIGRQWIVSDDAYGADYSYFFGGTGMRHATLSGARHDSLIKYNYTHDSFWVAANYGLDQDDAHQELAELYAGTAFGDLTIHFGGGKNTAKAYKVGSDDTDPADVKDVTADLRNTFFEGTVEYKFSDVQVGATYYNALVEDLNSPAQIDENAFSLAAMYSLTDKATIYSGFEYVSQKTSGLDAEDGNGKNAYLGSVYKFNSWARVYGEVGHGKGTTTGFTNRGSDSFVGPTSVKDGETNFAIGARLYW